MPMESEVSEEGGGIEDRADGPEQKESAQLTEPPNETSYIGDGTRAEYSPRKTSNPKKAGSKKSDLSGEEGLESLVRKSVAKAEAMKIDPAEYLSAELAGNPVRYSNAALNKAENDSEKEKEDTLDGSVVILYHIDKASGQVYLAFESKTEAYPIEEARGKLALFGGTTRLGESPPETASRELKEEDPGSYKTLIKALKDNGRKVDEVRESVDGVPSWTTIYAAEIKDPLEWKKYSSTTTTEGPKRILTLEETLIARSKNGFAFPSQGNAVYDFIKNYVKNI